MRKPALALFMGLFAATPALAEQVSFILVNNTSKTIVKVDVAPSGTGAWSSGITDGETKSDLSVRPGNKTPVQFFRSPGTCKFDARATFTDRGSIIWSGLNICDFKIFTVGISSDGQPLYRTN